MQYGCRRKEVVDYASRPSKKQRNGEAKNRNLKEPQTKKTQNKRQKTGKAVASLLVGLLNETPQAKRPDKEEKSSKKDVV